MNQVADASERVSCICPFCNREFLEIPSLIKRGKIRFCGKPCWQAHKSWTPEKFWNRVDRSGACWLWKGKIDYGYGGTTVYGARFRTHRLAYLLCVGDIPEELEVLHKCDVRNCVNPSHLFLGTQKDNMDDMVKKGRIAKGEKIANSKLTDEIVIAIRRKVSNGEKMAAVAKELSVPYQAVWDVTHRSWRHIA